MFCASCLHLLFSDLVQCLAVFCGIVFHNLVPCLVVDSLVSSLIFLCLSSILRMAPKQKRVGSRGPARGKGSAPKIRCAYGRCNANTDVKNVRAELTLKKENVKVKLCRSSLKGNCKLLRFCCLRHKQMCMLAPVAPKKRGQRAGLDSDQLIHLFRVLVRDGAPWAAVAMLLQTAMGERVGCVSKVYADL